MNLICLPLSWRFFDLGYILPDSTAVVKAETVLNVPPAEIVFTSSSSSISLKFRVCTALAGLRFPSELIEAGFKAWF